MTSTKRLPLTKGDINMNILLPWLVLTLQPKVGVSPTGSKITYLTNKSEFGILTHFGEVF